MKIPPFAALAVAVGAFGSIPVFVRYFAWHLDVWTVNGVRYCLVAVAAAIYIAVEHRRRGVAPSLWRCALVPAAVNVCGQILWGHGLHIAWAMTSGRLVGKTLGQIESTA